jgi:hypothetical protein
VVAKLLVTDEAWIVYIKNQAPPEPDENFQGNLSPSHGKPIRLQAVTRSHRV